MPFLTRDLEEAAQGVGEEKEKTFDVCSLRFSDKTFTFSFALPTFNRFRWL